MDNTASMYLYMEMIWFAQSVSKILIKLMLDQFSKRVVLHHPQQYFSYICDDI